MNGNRVVWPNTNQTNATRPAQAVLLVHRLSRIRQSGIAIRLMFLVEVGFDLDLGRKLVLSLNMSEFRSLLTGLDRFIKLARFSVSCRQSSDIEWILVLSNADQSESDIHCPRSISNRVVGSSCKHPG